MKRLIQKLLQRWRRCGGTAAETGAHDRTARTSERRVHTRAGVQNAATVWDAAHGPQQGALGRRGRRTAMPPHPRAVCGETSGGAGDGGGVVPPHGSGEYRKYKATFHASPPSGAFQQRLPHATGSYSPASPERQLGSHISYKTWRTENLRQNPYQCDMLISISIRHPSRML